MSFKIGLSRKVTVCRDAFRYTYGMTKDYLNTISKEVKNRVLSIEPQFNDKSNPALSKDANVQAAYREIEAKLKIKLNPDQAAARVIGNSVEVLECWAWMKYFFELVGDFQPNSNNEIHLEPCFVSDIWKVYYRDQMNSNKIYCLNYQQFAKVWVSCFP